MQINTTISTQKVWDVLYTITDPEIPVISIIDLGIVRSVSVENNVVKVVITPTYSGCPAMDVISVSIKIELLAAGFNNIIVQQVLSPAWTTEWITEKGKENLKNYGIAPPNPKQQVCTPDLFAAEESVQCPHCQSWHTQLISEFGSTACKSLLKCNNCKESFDYFKCH